MSTNRNEGDLPIIVLPIILTVMLGSFALVGVSLAKDRAKCSEPAIGVVISTDVSQSKTKTKQSGIRVVDIYRPIVRYSVDGKEYEDVATEGSSNQTYFEGQTVDIKYNKADPSEFVMAGSFMHNFIPYLLIVVGLVPVICIWVVFIRGEIRKRNEA